MEHSPRDCACHCGRQFVPGHGNQRYAPDCYLSQIGVKQVKRPKIDGIGGTPQNKLVRRREILQALGWPSLPLTEVWEQWRDLLDTCLDHMSANRLARFLGMSVQLLRFDIINLGLRRPAQREVRR
jgi:hypothetical protein